MTTRNIEDIIEEIIIATRRGVIKWDSENAIFGGYHTAQMYGIELVLFNIQDEKLSLVFKLYGTYHGGQILRKLVDSVQLKLPTHDSLKLEPRALLESWQRGKRREEENDTDR